MIIIQVVVCIWLIIGIINFHQLPHDLKQKSNLFHIVAFTIVSPVFNLWFLFQSILNKHN
jgi:hypothetical protein